MAKYGSIYHFDNPPVIETVLGVQFKRSSKISNQLLALYWNSLGPEWPNVAEAPLLEPQYEKFGAERTWGRIGQIEFKLSQDPSSRLRIKNKNKSRMIQVQNGRFHYNWMKQEGEPYPKYENVRPEFDKRLESFLAFLKTKEIEVEFDQWEVTYVNHLPEGSVWKSPADWSSVFHGFPLTKYDGVAAETMSFNSVSEIVPRKGRLHTSIKHGFLGKPEDGPRVIRVDLTARGPMTDNASLNDGLNTGREAIVRSFVQMTTESCHRYWGIKK